MIKFSKQKFKTKNKIKMIENIEKKEKTIINTISNLKNNKNPLSTIFAIAELKEVFINISETLLTNIEKNYSKKSWNEYLSIVSQFKKEWIFEVSYNYYINNHWVSKFKLAIDDYFEHSFFTDISFFYFTVSKIKKYEYLFKSLENFYNTKETRNKYFKLEKGVLKKEFLENKIEWFKSLNNNEILFIIDFLDLFENFEFEKILPAYNNWIKANIKVIKNITLFAFENKNKYKNICSKIIEEFVTNKDLYKKIIEEFEEEKIYEIISFLRKDLISYINIQTPLDYKTKELVNNYAKKAYSLWRQDLQEKIYFLTNKERDFLNIWWIKWDFARITFKRKFLEKNYPHIIDLTLWITSLPQDVFYLYKNKTRELDLENLKLYSEIKDLILYIDKSFLLNLSKPFILKKISHYFNNKDQKYYIIKFILCIIMTNSYSEYKKVSKFFYNLETFSRNNIESIIWRMMQYWWLFIFLTLIFFIAPAWVIIWAIIIAIKEAVTKTIWKIKPEIKMNLNFGISSFASIIWVSAIILWSTVWYKDNINNIYSNFKWAINAITLPASETLRLIATDLSYLKADLTNSDLKKDKNSIWLNDINYLEWKSLYDIKNKTIRENLPEINEKIQNNEDNTIAKNNTITENIIKKENYIYRIDRNNTFWDYANKFAWECNLNKKYNNYNKFILNSIEQFLIENRYELTKYIVKSNYRISLWDIPKKLPAIDYNLEWLKNIICKR